jgi:hypothetical protein
MHQNEFANIAQLEADLWSAADNLRANSKVTAGEYCMPVLQAQTEKLRSARDLLLPRLMSGEIEV